MDGWQSAHRTHHSLPLSLSHPKISVFILFRDETRREGVSLSLFITHTDFSVALVILGRWLHSLSLSLVPTTCVLQRECVCPTGVAHSRCTRFHILWFIAPSLSLSPFASFRLLFRHRSPRLLSIGLSNRKEVMCEHLDVLCCVHQRRDFNFKQCTLALSASFLPRSLACLLARTFHKREANERLNDAILLYLSFHFFPFRSSSSCHLTRNAEN